MTKIVKFENHTLDVINHDGQEYLTGAHIAKALNYESVRSISNLFNAHKGEFDGEMSLVIDSVTNGFGSGKAKRPIRIFNREGAWLIAMFARTEKAKAFRKWVLKVLGNVADGKEITVKSHKRLVSPTRTKKETTVARFEEQAKKELGGIVKSVVGNLVQSNSLPLFERNGTIAVPEPVFKYIHTSLGNLDPTINKFGRFITACVKQAFKEMAIQ